MRNALIIGITGQDGSYLAELLLEKGYTVHGLVRRASSFNTSRIDHILSRLTLHYGDLVDSSSLHAVLRRLAAGRNLQSGSAEPRARELRDARVHHRRERSRSRCGCSRPCAYFRTEVALLPGVDVRALREGRRNSADRAHTISPAQPVRVREGLRVLRSRENYREAHGMYCCNGILFNHESPRRGENFVTRKITRAVAPHQLAGTAEEARAWATSMQSAIGATRRTTSKAMWRMLQLDEPDDFVIATGQSRGVREFLERAFRRAGLDWRDYVEASSRAIFPTGGRRPFARRSSKAKRLLGWEPKVTFDGLVDLMVDAHLELAKREAASGPRQNP